jgi:antitoxin FitA
LPAKWFSNGANKDSAMVNLTIKNIPEQIYDQIQTRAKINHRTINDEILYILEHATFLQLQPIDSSETLERARKVRELTANYTVTADEIEKMINEGRE